MYGRLLYKRTAVPRKTFLKEAIVEALLSVGILILLIVMIYIYEAIENRAKKRRAVVKAIREGLVRKGGRNEAPTVDRPDTKPKPMRAKGKGHE